jgi:hypothetical membrane protein
MSASRKGTWVNLKGLPLSSWSGALALVLYLGLVTVAYLFYPSSFGPGGNWLSDLADKSLNPEGAIYCRLAPILAGLGLMVFFVGLKDWYEGQRSKPRIFMSIAQSFGVLGSLALIMTGWFSEDNPVPHLFWAHVSSYMCVGTVVFVGIALLYYRSVPKFLSVFCFVLAAFVISCGVFRRPPWVEWLGAVMLVIFVTSVSYMTYRHLKQGQ